MKLNRSKQLNCNFFWNFIYGGPLKNGIILLIIRDGSFIQIKPIIFIDKQSSDKLIDLFFNYKWKIEHELNRFNKI